ncbi:MAG: C1 family peptidase [Chitinophagaceae bacterium]
MEKGLTCSTYEDHIRSEIKKLIPKAKSIKPKVANGWIPLDPNNIDQIRLSIDNDEPVIVAFYVSNSFLNMWEFGDSRYPGKNVWTSMNGPYIDAHCVCIIGYDNVNKMFKVRNSWGDKNSASKNPNEAGFFWVTYDLVQRGCFKEAYCFLPEVTK